MAITSYQDQAELLLKEYLLDDSLIPYISVVVGIFACKMVYDISQLFSPVHFKSYSNLTKMQCVEWNNRAISSFHAVLITVISLYLIFFSDLFSDHHVGLITHQSSPVSTFALGVSVGYFIADLAMIIWFYPSLGGMEYVLHHFLSMMAVAYAMLTGEGQLYTFMVLISETTTPGINLRWYLDTAGMKRSKAYLINGVVIFLAWLVWVSFDECYPPVTRLSCGIMAYLYLVARILLFIYLFYHIYLHYDQVKQLHKVGRVLVLTVPVVLSVMNLMWFWKIIRGLKKTLAKRHSN